MKTHFTYIITFLYSVFLFGQNVSKNNLILTEKDNINLKQPEKGFFLNNQESQDLKANAINLYKATVINTNFVIPLIRFNTVNKNGADNNQKGNVSFFNSIGAGISINWGELELITDSQNNVISREMNSTVGLQLGFLFAANSSSGNNTNIFAPTLSFSILDFQLGCGYELGKVSTMENRFFYTLAYSIPLSKLLKGKFYVIKREPEPQIKTNGFY